MKHLLIPFNRYILLVCIYAVGSCSETNTKKRLVSEFKSTSTVFRNRRKIIDVSSENGRELFGYMAPSNAIALSTSDLKTMYGILIFIAYHDINDISSGKQINTNPIQSPHFIAIVTDTDSPYSSKSWHTRDNGNGYLTITSVDSDCGLVSAEFSFPGYQMELNGELSNIASLFSGIMINVPVFENSDAWSHFEDKPLSVGP